MLDKHLVPLTRSPLQRMALMLQQSGVSANQVTVAGFIVGIIAMVLVANGYFIAGMLLLMCNRIADGIDGELARLTGATDAGAFLDICLDFLFYAFFPVAFAVYDPTANGLAAAILVASFIGTGASFLAFSGFARTREKKHPEFAYKGLYYLDGLAEGSETIIAFILMCLFPGSFPLIAGLFAVLCVITAVNRIWFGFKSLS